MDELPNLIHINTAEVDELTALPGIGRALAKRIAAKRPFNALDDLRQVRGVNASVLEGIAPHVSFAAPEPPVIEESVQADSPLLAEPGDSPLFVDLDAPAAEIVPVEILPPAEALLEAAAEPDIPAALESAELDLEPLNIPEPEPPTRAASQPVVETPTPSEVAPVAPAPHTPPGPKMATRGQALGYAMGCGFLSFIMSSLLIVLLLTSINGGLRFVTPGEFSTLRQQIGKLETQSTTLQRDVNGLQTRLDNLESLAGRVSTVEKENQALREEIGAASSQAKQVGQQIDQLNASVKEMQSGLSRFQNFLDGLQKLLGQLSQPTPVP